MSRAEDAGLFLFYTAVTLGKSFFPSSASPETGSLPSLATSKQQPFSR